MSPAEKVGELFKQKRQEKNISLREVETATSIRINYLQAIENGDLSHALSPVYLQGFVRQYASYLGIDGEQIIRSHPEIFNTALTQEFSFGVGTLEARDNPGSGVKWLPNFVWIGAFFLLLTAAWFFAKMVEVI